MHAICGRPAESIQANYLNGEMNVNWKLTAVLACSAALLVGACSGGNPPAGPADAEGRTPDGDTSGGTPDDDNGDDDNGDSTTTAQRSLAQRATAAIEDAEEAAAGRGDVAAARAEIERVKAAIAKAVTDAERAYTASAGGTSAERLAAYDARAAARQLSNRQTPLLDRALGSLAWYGRTLLRYKLADGEAVEPNDGANTIRIFRTPRTKDASSTDDTQIANTGEDVITANKFKTIRYSAGKGVFGGSGEEFKVDGYVAHAHGRVNFDSSLQTGLTITNSGLQIRTGGLRTRTTGGDYETDYLDMRKKVNVDLGDTFADVANGGNAWDLKITFDEPLTRTYGGSTERTNWFGNGDFYWRGIGRPDSKQLNSQEYHVAGTFARPAGEERLGIYEVWLSNSAGVDNVLEPDANSGVVTCPDGSLSSANRGACPSDDKYYYLNYAAYGLFVFSGDHRALGARGTVGSGTGGVTTYHSDGTTATSDPSLQIDLNTDYYRVLTSRVQGMHFGYTAFADSDGQRTKDIGTAVTGGTFHGATLARAFTGTADSSAQTVVSPANAANRFLRGDATLTVNIAKGDVGATNLRGELSNFEEWSNFDKLWVAYPQGFKVYMNADGTAAGAAVPIAADGAFNGVAKFNLVGQRRTSPDQPDEINGPSVDGWAGLRPITDLIDPAASLTRPVAPSPSDLVATARYNQALARYNLQVALLEQLTYGGSGAIYGAGPDGAGGVFQGNFYGNRESSSDLEIAGSWGMGPRDATAPYNTKFQYNIIGSFGAKQRPED